jgi:hypothetical protein
MKEVLPGRPLMEKEKGPEKEEAKPVKDPRQE